MLLILTLGVLIVALVVFRAPIQRMDVDKWFMISVGVQLAGVLFVFFLVYVLLFLDAVRAQTMSGLTATIFSGYIAVIVWSAILFKTPMIKWWFVDVKDNTALILGAHGLIWDKIPTNPNDRAKLFERYSLREVGSGIRGKAFTEVPVASIDLKSEIIIGPRIGEKPLECVSFDNIPLRVFWQVKLTSFVGYLTNNIRHDEAAIKAFFTGYCEQFIAGLMIQSCEKDIREHLADPETGYKAQFERLFNGKLAHPKEIEYGVWTGIPQLISIEREEKWKSAAQAPQIATKMQEAIANLRASFDSGEAPNPDVLTMLAAAMTGTIGQFDPVVLVGANGVDPKTFAAIQANKNKGGKKP